MTVSMSCCLQSLRGSEEAGDTSDTNEHNNNNESKVSSGQGVITANIAGVSPDNASGSSGKSNISEHNADSGHPDSPDDDGLGPLPPHWEKAYTDKGEPYFIDHNTGKKISSIETANCQLQSISNHCLFVLRISAKHPMIVSEQCCNE